MIELFVRRLVNLNKVKKVPLSFEAAEDKARKANKLVAKKKLDLVQIISVVFSMKSSS
jgi:hypothetical protein